MQSIKRHFPFLLKKLDNFWTFPAILTLILIVLSALSISGSSIGIYHQFFYGDEKDSSLLFNTPESIRSDEWIVSSQKAIAQSNNNFQTINDNIGNGEDESLIGDSPVRDWSVIFKPQNIGFLFFPFDNAFALRWWTLSYLLVLSAYFFAHFFLKKKVLAVLLSLIFLFSPFFHWWYTNGTFATVYYALFGFVVFANIFKAKNNKKAALWSLLLAYVGTSFAITLYPPFQIPVGFVLLALFVGFLLNNRHHFKQKTYKIRMGIVVLAGVLTLSTVLLFLFQHKDVVLTIQNTSYPGHRIVESGGYSATHLLASHLDGLLQSPQRSEAYKIPAAGALNQSESSNFIILIPVLLIPLLYLGYKKFKREKKIDFYIITSGAVGLLFFAWLFIPHLGIVGKLSLLQSVPANRLLIGIGVLNLFTIIYFVHLYSKTKKRLALYPAIIYSLLALILYIVIDLRIVNILPGFIGFKTALLFSIPIPFITFLLIRKHFKFALVLLAIFSFFSVCFINPIYHGTNVLTKTPLVESIKNIGSGSNKKWASEGIIVENFASMAGVGSVTGTQLYPQNNIWSTLNQPLQKEVFNRYAHVNFAFDRDQNKNITPVISNPGFDQLNIRIEPCDPFFKRNGVGFIITTLKFSKEEASCLNLANTVHYPSMNYYIYSLNL